MQERGIGAAVLAANKEKRAAIAIMHDDERELGMGNLGHDNCWALAQSSRGIFRRRTAITEHTRTVPFSFPLPGAKANKAYAYHIMAFASAYISIDRPSLFTDPVPSLKELLEITQSKAESSATLCHSCGNAFCCNPTHLYVASKRFNGLQEYCHHFLRMMTKDEQIVSFQQKVCELFHDKPPGQGLCWSNNYDLQTLDYRRVTFSELHPAEEQEEEPL